MASRVSSSRRAVGSWTIRRSTAVHASTELRCTRAVRIRTASVATKTVSGYPVRRSRRRSTATAADTDSSASNNRNRRPVTR